MVVPPDQLLASLRAGNPQAVTQWFKTYHRDVFKFVKTKITSESDAEEIVQETFINCLKQLPFFRGNSSLKTWMLGIARHEVADYYRKRYAKKAILALPLTDLISASAIGDAHDISEKVHHVVHKMSEYNRELLFLKYVDEKKVAEIATLLGRSIKAIESELFRARLEFRTLYSQHHV